MSLNKKPKTINPDEVDPSVYYYDEVYDDMKDEEATACKSSESGDRKKTKQGSKYIQGLIETADLRKSEKEIRKFKKFARDRDEAEADGLLDKADVYVTASYEKKLKEIKMIEEEHKKRLAREEDKVMNFHKSRHRDHSHKQSKVDTNSSETKIEKQEDQVKQDDILTSDSTEPTKNDLPNRPPKRQLKTLEDRREYLREVLAKRTVGQVFIDAQERYRQRKGISQK